MRALCVRFALLIHGHADFPDVAKIHHGVIDLAWNLMNSGDKFQPFTRLVVAEALTPRSCSSSDREAMCKTRSRHM